MNQFVILNANDMVAVALQDIKAGTILETPKGKIQVTEDITRGHKIALQDIAAGESISKYGFPIGHATQDIKKGEHVK
jgi:altronate hydrolase